MLTLTSRLARRVTKGTGTGSYQREARRISTAALTAAGLARLHNTSRPLLRPHSSCLAGRLWALPAGCSGVIRDARCLSSDAKEAGGDLPDVEYTDSFVKEVLNEVRTIAMVGASSNWNRPSYFAMKYMQAKGYRVVPINPGSAGKLILGEHTYKDLAEMDAAGIKVDMVDVFQRSDRVGPVADAAIAIGAKVLWMQLGVRNDEAAARAEAAGLKVVQNRCPKIEFSRLFGELGWHGFNSGVISSKRRAVGSSGDGKKTADSAGGEDIVQLPDLQFRGFETRAIHAGAAPCPTSGARSTPIHQTTAYVFDDADHAASLFNLQTFGNIYSRLSNPTVSVLEERIANLEGGVGSTCTASGHAAQFLAIFTLMQPGDKLVASNRLYGGSITQLGKTINKFDWYSCSYAACF